VHSHFLAVDGVRVSFGKGEGRVCALRPTSVGFEPSTLSLIMGPSGSGKTTLLSLLGCLLSPDDGCVFVDGVPVHELSEKNRASIRREKIGFVFQAFRLLHSLSALDNVALALDLRDGPRPDHVEIARGLLAQFGLQQKFKHQPEELSPGEKQRVAVARALIGNPKIILADEPTASLDADAARNICRILRNEVDQNGRTVVVVTHDVEWQRFADRTVMLSRGQVAESLELATV
jgi:putative ABC transport system ATP-binding protein